MIAMILSPISFQFREVAIAFSSSFMGGAAILTYDEGILRAKDRKERYEESIRLAGEREHEKREAAKRHEQLMLELVAARAQNVSLQDQLKLANSQIDSLMEPSRARVVSALRLGFGSNLDQETKRLWLQDAEDLEITEFYLAPPGKDNSVEISEKLKRVGTEVSEAYSLGSTLCLFAANGFEGENGPPGWLIQDTFVSALESFRVKDDVIQGVKEFIRQWYIKEGKPSGSRLYFLLLWLYLSDYEFGHSLVGYLQDEMKEIEKFISTGFKLIDSADFETACRRLIERAPTRVGGSFLQV